jgi:hypothetical protein
VRCNAI